MAGGQPRGCRRQIYERLSPRQVRRGSKHRGKAALGAAGGSARIASRTPSLASLARLRFASPTRRLPPGGGRPLLPAGVVVVIIIILIFSPTRDIQSRFIHFCPFPSFASRLGSQPAAAPHAPSRRAGSPPPRAGAPRRSRAGSRRRPSLPAGSPLPRAGKCRKSSPSPPALSPGLDRSRRSPATGCKTHQPFRGCAGDGITIIML